MRELYESTQVSEQVGRPGPRAEGDTPVRVVLAGLSPIYRHGLGRCLDEAGMACTSIDAADQLRRLLTEAPQLIGDDGLVVVLNTRDADAALLALPGGPVRSVHLVEDAGIDACAEALRRGATGVVDVNAELSHVVSAVRAAASGMTLLTRSTARGLCRPQGGPAPQLLLRQLTWLRHLADSGTVSSLARGAGYSEREMYRLLGQLYAQLGAGNRTEALLIAERYGLLQEGS